MIISWIAGTSSAVQFEAVFSLSRLVAAAAQDPIGTAYLKAALTIGACLGFLVTGFFLPYAQISFPKNTSLTMVLRMFPSTSVRLLEPCEHFKLI